MDNQKFFELLFGKCSDSIISLTTLPDRTTRHYPVGEYPVGEIEKFSKDAVKLGAESNTYFSTWPRRSDVPDGVRGGSEDTQYATCLFADCDIAGPAHKAANLPSTKEEVLEFLKALEKPPTLIVDTGYGLDPFWIFKEPVLLTDDSDRNRINGILTGYGKFLIKEFRTRGWSLDNVFDPARMLRAPGSSNFKLDTPVPCHILWDFLFP